MASKERFLETWQYAADAAYVLHYYASGARLLIEIWDEVSKTKVGQVELSDFKGYVEDVKFYSVNDTVYITHSSFRPKKLVRYDDSTSATKYRFDLSDFDIKIDPVFDEYADRNVFKVQGGTFDTGATMTVTELALTEGQKENGAELLFTSESAWRGTGKQMLMLKHPTEMSKTYGLLYTKTQAQCSIPQDPSTEMVVNDAGGEGWKSSWVFAYGSVSVETGGKWSGRLVIQLWKPDMEVGTDGEPVNPEELAVIEVANASTNTKATRDITQIGSRLRVWMERREKSKGITVTTKGDDADIVYREHDNDTGCFVTISYAQDIPVYLRIKSVVAPSGSANGYAYCEAIHPFEGGFTSSSFAEGAWCENYGYPRTCGVFQERMVFGGSNRKPCTLWCSKTGDWSNFVQGSQSTSPIFATANTDNIDTIQWMQIAKSYIMFGSLSGEWYFGGSDGGSLKPTNYSFQRLSNFGSTRGVPAVLFGSATIVAKNGGKEVIDVSYNTLSEQGAGTNLSLFASHLLETCRVSDLSSTTSPSNILWVLTTSGDLLSFTYDGNNNVFAWSRHEVLSGVEAITSFRRDERDVLAMLVRDGGKLMLAELDPYRGDDYKNDSENPAEKEQVFMDEGADEGAFKRYESRVIPTPILADAGSAYGAKSAFVNFDIYLKTHNGDFDGDVWADGTEFEVKLSGTAKPYLFDNGFSVMNVKRVFGENRIVLPLNTGWSDCPIADIRTDYPGPLTITALGAEMKFF